MTGYNVEYSKQSIKDLKKLDKYTQRMLLAWIEKNLIGCENPRAFGKGLTANRAGQWRDRVQDEQLVILTLTIGHRREIYEN